MIVLNLKLNNIYGFEDFEINFTYPKKVINSIIEHEHLEQRERFRYKKAVVLMGANATGKTSLGKALHKIMTFIKTGNIAVLYDMLSDNTGSFTMDFVNEGFIMHRLTAEWEATSLNFEIKYASAYIDKMDSYEKCVDKLEDHTEEATETVHALNKLVGPINYRFAYPTVESSLLLDDVDRNEFLRTLRAVIKTLDPTLQEVIMAKDLKDTIIIKRKNAEIIVKEGLLLNKDILSTGTVEGIDVAIFLAAMQENSKTFYYCDEHFSHIHSDIEKRIFGLMLERIGMDEQLIFTTHNSDMLDLNLPKHSYMFLCKQLEGGECKVTAISGSEILKRNTDNIRNAVENDVFGSLPDESPLDELEKGLSDE